MVLATIRRSSSRTSIRIWRTGPPTGGTFFGRRAVLPVHGERKPVPLPPGIANPRVSPDGRWLAYHSAESGALEIFVQSFPALLAGRSAGKWRVSAAGGIHPEWRRDGHEIFYLTPDSTLMAVSVQASGAAFEPVSQRRYSRCGSKP